MIQRREVLEMIRTFRAEGVTRRRLLAAFADRPGDPAQAVEAIFAELDARGDTVPGHAGHVVATEFSDYHVGNVRMTSRGFAIVRGEEGGAEPIVVPPEAVKTALDGDVVLVHRSSTRRKGKTIPDKNGEIIRVLHRRHPTLVGRFDERDGLGWVTPLARRIDAQVQIVLPAGSRLRTGEFVETTVETGEPGATLRGQIVRSFGMPDEPGVDEEVVLAEAGIPVDFAPAAAAEAAALPERVRAEDLPGRHDHRDQAAVTIDGETARDFDDAVFARPGKGESVEVFVHIADVTHYVTPRSALDAAARERGTSVYLPGRCVPMLPEKLSNQICSLLADEDRLAFSVRFLVNPDGAVEGGEAFRTVFRSRRRCTYTEVFSWLESGAWPAELPTGVRSSLELLHEAARRLGERRRQRGSIDFDLAEAEILLDSEGFMTGIQAAERNLAHRLIEELMVAANETVARILTWRQQPAVFRVHDKPSAGKLAELDAVLREFGFELKGDLDDIQPSALQAILHAIQGRPEERLLQALVLRSLARAVYAAECKGHYALATKFYLHFTSPIRRLPDLIVHRMLAAALTGQPPTGTARKLLEWDLEEIAVQASLTERRAAEAEREVVRFKQVRFMRGKIGEEFAGHVAGVTAFGVFVQLAEIFVEGLVHVFDLKDDYYRYDETAHRLVGERRGRVLRLGDPLRVRVTGIDEEHMEVRFAPVGEPSAPTKPARTGRRGKSNAVLPPRPANAKHRPRRR